MSKNALATQKSSELSLAGASALVSSIKDGMKLVSQGYLAITPDVAKLYDHKGYKALGYKNFDEMCAMEFGMSHGTTVGIRKVFDKFGSVSKDNAYTISGKYLEYGYTKLLLFTDKKFAEAGIDPIEAFTPDMTMAEMKSALSDKLTEKAKEQDKSAIDTTAEDVSRETSEQAEEKSIIDNSEEPAEEKSPVEQRMVYTQEILTAASILKDMCIATIKPEKLALLDAVIANIKDFEKEVKKSYK